MSTLSISKRICCLFIVVILDYIYDILYILFKHGSQLFELLVIMKCNMVLIRYYYCAHLCSVAPMHVLNGVYIMFVFLQMPISIPPSTRHPDHFQVFISPTAQGDGEEGCSPHAKATDWPPTPAGSLLCQPESLRGAASGPNHPYWGNQKEVPSGKFNHLKIPFTLDSNR